MTAAMSQSEKSKYKVRQWQDSDSPVTKPSAMLLAAGAVSHPEGGILLTTR